MKGTIHRTTKLLSRLAGSLMLGMLVLGCHTNVSSKDTTPPAEVTELKTVTGDGKVSLSWKNPGDTDLYQVEITASPAAGTLAHPVYLSAEKGKAMSFTAEGLSNDTAYTFTVKTLDKALNSSTGVTTEAVKPMDTSDKTPPAEVTDLKADVKGSAVLLSWKNPADDDLYQVEMTASPAAGSLATPIYLKAQKGATGSFSVEGLANGTEYTFTVRTIDTALHKSTGATVKKTIQQGENTPVAYSDLDGYLSNTASSTGINYITVTGLTPDLVTGKNWYEGYRVPSPLGKILKAHSDKRVALTLSSVSALGDNAFVDCISLTSVTMSEGIASIGNGAFKSCTGLTSITIPNTVTDIGTEAFTDCTSLKSITIPDSVRNMSNAVFKNCTALETVHLSTEINGIWDEMFYNCVSLNTITIPNKVNGIGARAFQNCESLTNITIPDSVTYMSNAVFKNCTALETVHLSTEINGIDNEMFYNCVSLNTITIPNKVNNIGSSAFQNCEKLKNITIPNSVTYMSDGVFKNCTALETVQLSTEINGIREEMFYNCVSLKTITIPNKVNYIGKSAFQNCKSLTNITIPNHVASIEGGAFSGCTGLTKVELPTSINDLTSNPFSGCTSLTTLTVDSGNTKYGSTGNTIYTKDNPKTLVCVAGGLTSVTIPDGVTKIGWGAFGGCIHLTEVKLPASINQLQGNPFSGCTNLTTLTVDDGNATYGSAGNMIYTKNTNTLICVAPGLAGSVTIPVDVKSIGDGVFSSCKKLESVTIPANIQFISSEAFDFCTNVEIVLAEGISTAINIQMYAFGSGEKKETLCKKVKIKDDANYEALKNKVVASGYPEDRIEKY